MIKTANNEGVNVVAVSFDQFRVKLVDARSYLTPRQAYPFGSVRDPRSGRPDQNLNYVPLVAMTPDGNSYSTDDLVAKLLDGKGFVLLGDHGAGKSATVRTFERILRHTRACDSTPLPGMGDVSTTIPTGSPASEAPSSLS